MLNRVFVRDSNPIQILLVGGTEQEMEYFRLMFPSPGWQVRSANTVRCAGRLLGSRAIRMVLTTYDLPDGTWNDILEQASQSSELPPVVVADKDADERMWAEVLNLGGYDVLLKPFDPTEVRRVVDLALSRRMPVQGVSVQAARAAV